MPVTSINGKRVIDSGSFVLNEAASEAVITAVGSVFTIGPDVTLAPDKSTVTGPLTRQNIRFGPFPGGTNRHPHLTMETEDGTYDVSIVVQSMGSGMSRYAITYSIFG